MNQLLSSIITFLRRRRLTTQQWRILSALAGGLNLKSHRQLDGTKYYRLHSQSGASIAPVPARDVERLRALGLIASNMKFPAATYLLTDKGLELATRQGNVRSVPLTSLRFGR